MSNGYSGHRRSSGRQWMQVGEPVAGAEGNQSVGLFRQLKDAVQGAQAMSDLDSEVAAQTQALEARAIADPGSEFDPIGPVSLELYVQVSKDLAAVGHDGIRAPGLVADRGISELDWAAASAGWNARIEANPAVSAKFDDLSA